MADLNLKAGTNMSIRQEDTDLYLDNTYEYDDTEIQQDLLTRSLITETGNIIELTLNTTNYKMTAILKNKYGNVISTSNEIDLPIESLVVSIYYDSTTKELVFVLKDGTTTRVPLLDLIDGLATEEDLQTFEDDINEDMETFKGDVEQELEKAQQELDMYKMLENALPKVEGEGETIHLEDTAKCPMKLGFKGQIQQDSTTGTNLISLDTQQCKVSLNAGDYIVAKNETSNDLTLNFYTNYGDSTRNDFWSVSANNFRKISVGYNSGAIKWATTPDGLAWVNAGETSLPYEPYTGGSPSPNPTYPQEIHNVSGDNTIEICGKNLFGFGITAIDKTSTYRPNSSQRLVLTAGDNINEVKFNYASGSYCTGYFEIANIDGTLNYTISFDVKEKTTQFTPVVAIDTTNSTTDKLVVMVSGGNGSTRVTTSDYFILNNIMVRLSSTSADYEAYTGQTQLISLGSIELCKIGDYQDIPFKAVNGDDFYKTLDSATKQTLTYGKWYLHKEIGKVVLDGSESWSSLGGSGSNPYYAFYNNNTLVSNSIVNSTLYANYFITDNISGLLQKDGGCRIAEYNSVNRVFFCIHSITSVNDFKTWLSTHNTIVYYVLATPQNILLNDTLQETLDSFYSYQNQTNISQENNDIPFVIKASAIYDLTNLVNRVATLETE